MSENIWLINNGLGLGIYVKEEHLERVAQNFFIAGGTDLVMMELEEILDVGEEPKPLQTVTVQNMMGLVEWLENTGRKTRKECPGCGTTDQQRFLSHVNDDRCIQCIFMNRGLPK